MDLDNNFHPDAREEYLDRVRYQRDHFPELAQEWIEVTEQVYTTILRDPLQPREREFGHRRVRLGKFPHYFAYIIREENIWIVAVGSSSQQDLYWKKRLDDDK
jgi:hypothetical protein